jgi:hypothetical protein
MLAKPWNELTEAEKAVIGAHNRGYHTSTGRELAQTKKDARADAFDEAIYGSASMASPMPRPRLSAYASRRRSEATPPS